MSVYKDPRSDNYTIEFQIGGERYKKTHEGVSSQRDAENLERSLKIEMKDRQRSVKDQRGKPVTVDEALDRFVADLTGTSSEAMTRSYAKDSREFFSQYKRDDGSSLTLLHELADADVAAFVTWKKDRRRWNRGCQTKVANSTINQATTNFLRRVCRRAEAAYGVRFNEMPVWRLHILKQAKKRTRRMTDAEHPKLIEAIDPEVVYLMQFALVSGLRKSGSLLRWADVDFDNKTYKFINKGNNPDEGFALVERKMTPAEEMILRSRQGHHPEWVFTFIRKTRPNIGTRQPIDVPYLDSRWRRAREVAGVLGLRWHDLRRTFASLIYKQTRDLPAVQGLLGHADPKTTMKYIVVEDEDQMNAATVAGNHFMANFTPVQAITHQPRLVEDKRKAS